MNRIKMPLNFRLQNFFFEPNGSIFWFSASKTLAQKFKRWRANDHSSMANMSNGHTIPIHGQNVIRLKSGYIMQWRARKTFTPEGIPVALADTLYIAVDYFKISCLSKQFLQGIAFKDELFRGLFAEYAVFGTPSTDDIEVFNVNNEHRVTVKYQEMKKWYWRYWEAEGIQILGNEVHIGISVKTIFGAILNYTHRVKISD